jgi:hypothetical protein
MSKSDNKFKIEELFNFDFSEDLLDVNFLDKVRKQQQRATVRYVRDDITVAICKHNPFVFGKEVFIDLGELIDINCRGLLVSSNARLKISDKIVLNLRFKSGRSFKIIGSIVHKSALSPFQYGVKFDRYNDELGNYLLETQSKLIFK